MNCDRWREAASARLDDEPLGLPATALDHHLATCPDCARWLESAIATGRSLRVSGDTPPDLTGRILASVVDPSVRVGARRRWLRVGLGALGLLQWALAIQGLAGNTVGMQMAAHASHESAAWNLAVGASFVAVAIRPARALGAAPILGTFLAALTILSLPDLVGGQVAAARLASHGGVAIGFALIVLLTRSNRLIPGTPVTDLAEADDTATGPEPSGLRVVTNQQGVA